MAAPRRSPAEMLDSSTTNNDRSDAALLSSLHQLSLSDSKTPPRRPTSRASSHSPKPLAQALSALDRLTIGSPSPRGPLSRSVSSQSRSATPTLLRKSSTNSLRSNNPLNNQLDSQPNNQLNNRKSRLTEAGIAKSYFKSELEVLHAVESSKPADTIVIMHDSCYGHRFSRNKTTKMNLSTIVERPERIQACAVGVAMAYVRLGDRHCEGKIPIHPDLDPATLNSIPFRIHKTERKLSLNSPAVTNVHGTKWMEELRIMCDSAEEKMARGELEVKRPNMDRGTSEEPRELHHGDLYLCTESLAAFEAALGSVCDAVDMVFSASPVKRAFVAVRPPGHHCSASHPQGFCWINNVHVGIMHGMLEHGLTHAAIIDFDLHHGDGSQAIAWSHNNRSVRQPKNSLTWKKTSIGYFSLHDINSYPCEGGDAENVRNASTCIENAHGQNIWNVHLQPWSSEVEFWTLYQSKYSALLDKARSYLRRQSEKLRASGQVPMAAIFLSAGFDASEWEGAGMQRHVVNVPTEFYARLTRDVVKLASEVGLGVEGRVISALEGGYSDRALSSGVLSHLSGLAGSEPVNSSREASPMTTTGGLHRRMSSLGGTSTSGSRRSTISEKPRFPYDPIWWSSQELDKFDAAAAEVIPEIRPIRNNGALPTYCSPTQSFTAKIKRRSTGNGMTSMDIGDPIRERAVTPPPPEVYWPIAAYQLSRLLIPTNRPVNSVTWDELKSHRRERQSTAPDTIVESIETNTGVRKSLRERKPKAPSSVEKDRRKTVASSLAFARGIPAHPTVRVTRPHSRRLSSASTMTTATQADIDELSWAGIRPGSSQTIRSESSMSVRTQASSAAVKKPRLAAPKPRKTTTKTAAQKTDQEPLTPKAEPKPPKKIKINLITEEMKKAKMNEASVPNAWAPSSGGSEHVVKPAERFSNSKPEHELLHNLPTLDQTSGFFIGKAPEEIQLPLSSAPHSPGLVTTKKENRPPTPVKSSPARTPTQPMETDPFVSYQPAGPTPAPVKQQEGPLHWLPTNVADTPQQFKQKGHQFTATSAIPFASTSVQETRAMAKDKSAVGKVEQALKQENQNADVWEIPESPDVRRM